MRFLRIEVAIIALMLAPFAGYAISYFFIDGLAREMRPGSAAAVQDGARLKSLSSGRRGAALASPIPSMPSGTVPGIGA